MSTLAASRPAAGGAWMAIGRVSAMVGVDESTLRRWADAGLVRSFRTPGSHRRVSQRDLHALLAGGADAAKEAPAEQLRLDVRRRLAAGARPAGWYERLTEERQQRYRLLGRRLLDQLTDYALGRADGESLRDAERIGEQYGLLLIADDASLLDAMDGYRFFRDHVWEAAQPLLARSMVEPAQREQAWERMGRLADAVLLGIAGVYGSLPVARLAVGARSRR